MVDGDSNKQMQDHLKDKEKSWSKEVSQKKGGIHNISSALEHRKAILKLLREYNNVSVWTNEEMPVLDPQLSIQQLNIREVIRLIKQASRNFRPKLEVQTKQDNQKLLESLIKPI